MEAAASGCLSMVQLRLLLDELVYLAQLLVLESAGQSQHLWLFGIVVAVSRGKDLAAKGRFGDSRTCCWYELAVSFASDAAATRVKTAKLMRQSIAPTYCKIS